MRLRLEVSKYPNPSAGSIPVVGPATGRRFRDSGHGRFATPHFSISKLSRSIHQLDWPQRPHPLRFLPDAVTRTPALGAQSLPRLHTPQAAIARGLVNSASCRAVWPRFGPRMQPPYQSGHGPGDFGSLSDRPAGIPLGGISPLAATRPISETLPASRLYARQPAVPQHARGGRRLVEHVEVDPGNACIDQFLYLPGGKLDPGGELPLGIIGVARELFDERLWQAGAAQRGDPPISAPGW